MPGRCTWPTRGDGRGRRRSWLPASRLPLHLHPPSSPTGNGTTAQPIHDEALAAVGQILLDSVDEIVRRHIETLKTDRSFFRIEMMTDVQIADHEATFLADIAQSLLILEGTPEPAEPMRDQSVRHTATVDA